MSLLSFKVMPKDSNLERIMYFVYHKRWQTYWQTTLKDVKYIIAGVKPDFNILALPSSSLLSLGVIITVIITVVIIVIAVSVGVSTIVCRNINIHELL